MDNGTIGSYSAVDSIISSVVPEPSSAKVLFTNVSGLTVPENSSKNILITFQHPALNSGKGIKSIIPVNAVKGYGKITLQTNFITNSISGVLKKVPAETTFIISLT